MPVLEPGALIENRVDALRAFHRQVGQARAEIDVSGGVDSATLFALLVRALGAEQVTAVFLGINSSDDSRARAVAVAKALGARLVVDELGEEFELRVHHMIARLVEAGYDRAAIERRVAEDPTVLGSIRTPDRGRCARRRRLRASRPHGSPRGPAPRPPAAARGGSPPGDSGSRWGSRHRPAGRAPRPGGYGGSGGRRAHASRRG